MTTPELPPIFFHKFRPFIYIFYHQTMKNNRRIFDFFHDDTPVTNAIRKWGPVQLLLLQDGSSEGPRGRPVASTRWQEIGVIPRLGFPALLKKGKEFLDI